MELAGSAILYQLDGILEHYRPVEAMRKGFTNQCAGRCVVPTLASIDLCE
jgi:hypothetical protein